MFFTEMTFFSFNVLSVNSLECISMKNRECKVREEVINVNINNPVFYPFSVKVNKRSENCNNISNPYVRLCVPDVVKNINLKVFNLMSWSNQAKQIKWHESCKYECSLNSSIFNNKQKWNKDKCRCECLINKKSGNKFWNPNSCKCEYRKKAAHLLTEECEEIIDNKTVPIKKYNKTVSVKNCNSYDPCKPYIVSSILSLLVSVIITGLFVYFYVNSQSKKLQDCY